MPKFKLISKLQMLFTTLVAFSWLFAQSTSVLCGAAAVVASSVLLGAAVRSVRATCGAAVCHADCDPERKARFVVESLAIAVAQWLLAMVLAWDVAHQSGVVPYTLGYALGVMLASCLLFKAASILSTDFESVAILA